MPVETYEPSGVLFFLLFVSVPVTALLSFVVLARYRKSVARSMRAMGGATPPVPASPDAVAVGPPATVELVVLDVADEFSLREAAEVLLRRCRDAPRRAAVVYALAGTVHALIATVLLLRLNDIDVTALRLLSVGFLLAWPVVPTVLVVAVGNRRLKVLGPVLFVLVALLINPVSLTNFLSIWAVYMGIPTALFLAFSNRRVRAVGPLILLLVLFVAFSAVYALHAAYVGLVLIEGVAASDVVFFSVVVWIGLFAGLGWWLLKRLAARYERKRLSDQRLLVDTWWLLFTLWECSFLMLTDGLWGLVGLVAFAAYAGVLGVGLGRAVGGGQATRGARLLMLRVFGYRARTECLFAELALYWRYLGSIRMIAGTDLATMNLEPHEFFAYIHGRLSRQFVKDAEDLDRRVAALDETPDPDGRYRIHEFFCHDDTWRVALQRLVRESDAVLMDLRGFTRDNQGCVYEIHQLLDIVPTDRVVLALDDTTDVDFLREMVEEAAAAVGAGSPNAGVRGASLRAFRVTQQGPAEVKRLLGLLCDATVQSP